MVEITLVAAFSLTAVLAQSTTRVSVDSRGVQGSSTSLLGSCSGDGRLVAFQSNSTGFAANDGNGLEDVFVHDRASGALECVSLTAAGATGDGASLGPRISADGRFVAFASDATDLVTGDTNGLRDVFVRDCLLGTTVCASRSSSGAQADGPSATSLFQGNGPPHHSPYTIDLSGDGRFVCFESLATNLVNGDTNNVRDIFVHDCVSGATERVSVDSSGAQSPNSSSFARISADGSRVSFWSLARLAPTDLNDQIDAFVRDRTLGVTLQASVGHSNLQSNGNSFALDISGDGRFVLLQSNSTTLLPGPPSVFSQIYLRDLVLGETTIVSVSSSGLTGNSWSGLDLQGALSHDARFVLFDSWASNLGPGDTNSSIDIFVRDRLAGTTERVNLNSSGIQAFGRMRSWSISDDGRVAAFQADGEVANLAAGDTNAAPDVFARDRSATTLPVTTYCTAKVNSAGCVPAIGASGAPSFTGFDAFFVTATGVRGDRRGLFFWSAQSAAVPFGGGYLCVRQPIARTPSQDSAPELSGPCSGSYSFHFARDYMLALALAPGVTLHGQYWSLDPTAAAPQNIGLTNGLKFTPSP
ncbi:MAG: hypothetical protein FJ298_15550 [Planctomycetes bacterium]|nr:hypothetical protein [Planctomycetota bacterium]